jgi:hypothetical protein
MQDIQELKPTVPRLFNHIYDEVLAGDNAKGGLLVIYFIWPIKRKSKLGQLCKPLDL